jgi:hypothetical protein
MALGTSEGYLKDYGCGVRAEIAEMGFNDLNDLNFLNGLSHACH